MGWTWFSALIEREGCKMAVDAAYATFAGVQGNEIVLNSLNVPGGSAGANGIVPPIRSEFLARIGGRKIMFDRIEDKFTALVAEWRRLREPGSSTDSIINDAYG